MTNSTRPLNGSPLFFRHIDYLGSRGDGVTIAISNILLYTEMLQECLGIVRKHLGHRRVLASELLNQVLEQSRILRYLLSELLNLRVVTECFKIRLGPGTRNASLLLLLRQLLHC